LLYGVDDGAATLPDSLEMARALVELGFTDVAPSPHARPEYAPKEVVETRLLEVQQAVQEKGLGLSLHPNAENFFLDPELMTRLGSGDERLLGAGKYMLVEAPYAAPLPLLAQMVFRLRVKGVTPLIAHPERCLEFERDGRAREAVEAGARLQLDIGALSGRYGPKAKRLARAFLEEGLYSVAATDLHAPALAQKWVGKAMVELEQAVGTEGVARLLRDNPRRILKGEPVEWEPLK
jgi:protein-tyrosine phosphatase